MATDLKAFLQPISESDPCGPDLELEGDMEFMNYVARAEGILPASYFAFDRNSIEFGKEFTAITSLYERTHDLRLLVLYAKLLILNRDLSTFIDILDTISQCLGLWWNEIHPRSEGGDFIMRVAVLQSLEDAPHVILPLQFVPLIENRRYGSVTFRAYQIAVGKTTPREGETATELSTIERVLLESELDVIVTRRTEVLRIIAAAKRIQDLSIEFGGYENQISLDVLISLADDISQFLDRHIASRDPSAALNPVEEESFVDGEEDATGQAGGGTSPGSAAAAMPGSISSRKDALNALRAARRYYESFEPSSPALLLIQYAENLMGKPFYEVIRILIPDYYSRAALLLGQNAIKLAVGHISDSAGSSTSYEYQNSDQVDASEEAASNFPTPQSRRDAVKLLDLVTAYFRLAEPSSPIPLLISRAREMGERDFINLLRDLFADSVLRSIKGDDGY